MGSCGPWIAPAKDTLQMGRETLGMMVNQKPPFHNTYNPTSDEPQDGVWLKRRTVTVTRPNCAMPGGQRVGPTSIDGLRVGQRISHSSGGQRVGSTSIGGLRVGPRGTHPPGGQRVGPTSINGLKVGVRGAPPSGGQTFCPISDLRGPNTGGGQRIDGLRISHSSGGQRVGPTSIGGLRVGPRGTHPPGGQRIDGLRITGIDSCGYDGNFTQPGRNINKTDIQQKVQGLKYKLKIVQEKLNQRKIGSSFGNCDQFGGLGYRPKNTMQQGHENGGSMADHQNVQAVSAFINNAEHSLGQMCP